MFRKQLMRKQQRAGITDLRAILQLRKLEAAVSGENCQVKSWEMDTQWILALVFPTGHWGVI